MHHIPLDLQDEAVKRFFLALLPGPQGSVVELNGQAVACVVPMPAGNSGPDSDWTDEKNDRRWDLIDKEIDGQLTPAEAVELHGLQQEMLRYRHKVAPLPIAAAWKLRRELLKKTRSAPSDA